MNMKRNQKKGKHSGIAMIAALVFIALFSAFSVGMLSMASANLQVSNNHHKANMALNAALSGLECARYIAATTNTGLPTHINYVTDSQADAIWNNLCSRLQAVQLGGLTVSGQTRMDTGDGDIIVTQFVPYQNTGASFQVCFYRYDDDPDTTERENLIVYIDSSGQDGGLNRTVQMNMKIQKDAQVLNYALAGRGRMWLTGDTTIYGDIYSSWDRADISPFNMTSDSRVEGTINTVLALEDILDNNYQLETLDENGNPMFDEDGNRIVSTDDEIQGYHEGINYEQPDRDDLPGLSISDYNTSDYKNMIGSDWAAINGSQISGGVLPTSGVSTTTEYFPHAAGSYNTPKSSSSLTLNRKTYESKTLSNVVIPSGANALFRNCTFEDVLYVDCRDSGPSMYYSSTYNNIRFENCTFNGTIVTNTPQALNSGWWMCNQLYFTGEATFHNTSTYQEATILAPHFNVDIGNTNPNQSENNVLTGAIVGGIVDIRGNAQIYGTIISMADTTIYSSGYVTNIGVTLEDGGSETTEAGDIGVIEITPNEEQMLPGGITSPILLKPLKYTYVEKI